MQGADEVREEYVFRPVHPCISDAADAQRRITLDSRRPRSSPPVWARERADMLWLVHSANVGPVIDDFKPSLALHVKWPSGKHASLGNTLSPKKLQDAPVILLHDISKASACCDIGITYVVTLTDPDAPSRNDPRWSEFCHWIASATLKPFPEDPDSCGSCAGNRAVLDELMPYKPPGPPEKTGKHRYVFLVFVPRNGTTEKLHLSKPSERKHWGYGTKKGETKGVREWARENGLAPVGELPPALTPLQPVCSPSERKLMRMPAANFIYAKSPK